MFLCATCQSVFELPCCPHCGTPVERIDGIWQFTQDPDIVTDQEDDNYIGYEHIGAGYSGKDRYMITEKDRRIAQAVSRVLGDGVLLDLACGDGRITVPVAALGGRVIAADISRVMLRILLDKASRNSIDLGSVVIARMNAFALPIPDNTLDCIIANSFLHLVSHPEKVIREIRRVLKPGGKFLCLLDAPGTKETEANRRYHEFENGIYGRYWELLMQQGIYPRKYSWAYDRDAICDPLFSVRETQTIPYSREVTYRLSDYFMPRMIARGFSDQSDVPGDIHQAAIQQVWAEFRDQYHEELDTVTYHMREQDLLLTIYSK